MTITQALSALEKYCAYQERCHQEVERKLASLGVYDDEALEVIGNLLKNNYLNEERFARTFARGKHRIKSWGRMRITSELKLRRVTQANIRLALSEIDDAEYFETFNRLAKKSWDSLANDSLQRSKKFHDLLYRKGYESSMINEKLNELQKL